MNRPLRVLGVLIALLVASACTSQPELSRGGHRHKAPTTSPSASQTSASPLPTRTPSAGALPLGSATSVATEGPCPGGARCQTVRVTCPGVRESDDGTLVIGPPSGSPRGLLMLFSYGKGTTFWGDEDESSTESFLSGLQQLGIEVVRVRWSTPWLFSASGEQAGPAVLACRPATLITWVHDNLYRSLGVTPAHSQCGFCLTGDSGGASAIGYSLTDYGIGSIVDGAVMSSGPPHTSIAMGCLPSPGGQQYVYKADSPSLIDGSYGFLSGPGPCASHDASYRDRWNADSIDIGGRSFDFPTTKVTFLFGTLDNSSGPAHGMLLYDKLKSGHALSVSVETVTGMKHQVALTAAGLSALKSAFLS